MKYISNYNMKPRSNSLFHFTKSLEVLKLILKNGIEPRYCLEDIDWLGLNNQNQIAFPLASFCDIPLSRISQHTDFYGNYGIGFSKKWGLKNLLTPVIYTTKDGRVQNLLKFMWSTKRTEENEEDFDFYTETLFTHIKPISGRMRVSNEYVLKEFYQENEWRYVPVDCSFILDLEKFFNTSKTTINNFTPLKYSPLDIKYLFVALDSEIPELVDFINNELGHYSSNDLKVLTTRIVSLETLNQDI